jgi:hypothetical protein
VRQNARVRHFTPFELGEEWLEPLWMFVEDANWSGCRHAQVTAC